MFLKVKSYNYLQDLGLKSLKDDATLEFTQNISIKNEMPVTIIKLKDGSNGVKYLKENITQHNDSEIETILLELEETEYRVYNQFLLEQSMRDILVSFADMPNEYTEQERLKWLCDKNLTGVKPFSNLDYFKKW